MHPTTLPSTRCSDLNSGLASPCVLDAPASPACRHLSVGMVHLIYRTTLTTTGEYYVGVHSTMNIDDGYLGSGVWVRRAIRKHGKAAFLREVLCTCSTRVEALQIEMTIVETCNDDHLCMNLAPGGLAPPSRKGAKHSDESKKLMSEAHQNQTFSDSHREKLRIAASGKTLSPEHRLHIGKASRQRNAISNAIAAKRGSNLTDDAKKRISEGMKKRWAQRHAQANQEAM